MQAASAKLEALAAKKAAKEALDGVRESRAKAAKEMREKRQNIESNFGKVKNDLGTTKKQVCKNTLYSAHIPARARSCNS